MEFILPSELLVMISHLLPTLGDVYHLSLVCKRHTKIIALAKIFDEEPRATALRKLFVTRTVSIPPGSITDSQHRKEVFRQVIVSCSYGKQSRTTTHKIAMKDLPPEHRNLLRAVVEDQVQTAIVKVVAKSGQIMKEEERRWTRRHSEIISNYQRWLISINAIAPLRHCQYISEVQYFDYTPTPVVSGLKVHACEGHVHVANEGALFTSESTPVSTSKHFFDGLFAIAEEVDATTFQRCWSRQQSNRFEVVYMETYFISGRKALSWTPSSTTPLSFVPPVEIIQARMYKENTTNNWTKIERFHENGVRQNLQIFVGCTEKPWVKQLPDPKDVRGYFVKHPAFIFSWNQNGELEEAQSYLSKNTIQVKKYYPSGSVRLIEGFFIGDNSSSQLHHGVCEAYHEDGRKKYKKCYDRNILDGIQEEYDERGKLSTIMEFKQGWAVEKSPKELLKQRKEDEKQQKNQEKAKKKAEKEKEKQAKTKPK